MWKLITHVTNRNQNETRKFETLKCFIDIYLHKRTNRLLTKLKHRPRTSFFLIYGKITEMTRANLYNHLNK